MVERSSIPSQNEKITPPNSANALPKNTLPNLFVDLEAARRVSPTATRGAQSNTSPVTIPTGLFPPTATQPATSVTSLPVQGIEDAPTHRRRRNKRRRNHAHGPTHHGLGTGGGSANAAGNRGLVVPTPRRANSMPANPDDGNIPPIDWNKGFATLLQPQKKIVAKPNFTQCFGKTNPRNINISMR